MFFDLHVHGNENIIKEAERLGYAGIAVTRYLEEYNYEFSKEFNDLKASSGILLKKCIEIVCKNPGDLKKKVQKSRKNADIIMVRGGDLKINRAACEERSIDILSQPYRSRRDTGINHVLAKKAAENNVAIEINLKNLLKYEFKVQIQDTKSVQTYCRSSKKIQISTDHKQQCKLKIRSQNSQGYNSTCKMLWDDL